MKIHEVIITTCDMDDNHHVAPMGINIIDNEVIIKPFKPSKTLENLRETKSAIVNFIDDVRVFAGIVTGIKREWDLEKVIGNKVMRLKEANSHSYCSAIIVKFIFIFLDSITFYTYLYFNF